MLAGERGILGVRTNFKVAFSSFGAVAVPLRTESVGSSM